MGADSVNNHHEHVLYVSFGCPLQCEEVGKEDCPRGIGHRKQPQFAGRRQQRPEYAGRVICHRTPALGVLGEGEASATKVGGSCFDEE
jgi:hypothetical protein